MPLASTSRQMANSLQTRFIISFNSILPRHSFHQIINPILRNILWSPRKTTTCKGWPNFLDVACRLLDLR